MHAWLHGPCLFRCPENGGHVAEVWPAKWWEDSGADQELDPWQAKLQGRDGLLWHWVVCWLMWFLFWKFWQGMWETSHKSALFCIHFMSTVCSPFQSFLIMTWLSHATKVREMLLRCALTALLQIFWRPKLGRTTDHKNQLKLPHVKSQSRFCFN